MHNSNALLPSGEIYMAAGWSPVKGKKEMIKRIVSALFHILHGR